MEPQVIIQWRLFCVILIFPIALKTYIFVEGVYILGEEFHSVYSLLK